MSGPRVRPGGSGEIGAVNALIVRALGRASGTTHPPNLFATLARHPRLFRGWLWFAGSLMPGGSLPRADTELVILRVAHNTGSEYEWGHHERLARTAGLSAHAIARAREPADAPGWSERQALLLRAVDQLHQQRALTDELWASLRDELSEQELIELVMLIGHYQMLAMTIANLGIEPDRFAPARARARARARTRARARSRERGLAGRRVLITGAARGIGAATARRLHERGARVALAGIEPELLRAVAADCGGAPAMVCDVRDREQVERAMEDAVAQLGGLDAVIANAGVAAQLPVLGGDPEVFERTLEVNLLGAYYTLRAAAPHIAHPGGYALAVSSLAAAVHPPLLGAYSASKAGVEALADALRAELASSGARVGVAYFAELETDMTSVGFGTEAARRLPAVARRTATPLHVGIDAIERGVQRRSRHVVAPSWVAAVLPIRALAQRAVELGSRLGLDEALEVARREHAPLTTSLPDR